MARIFLALVLLSVALLLGNLVLGVVLGDFGVKSHEYALARARLMELEVGSEAESDERARFEQISLELAEQRNRFWPHVWLGIVATLIALLVNSISITYFIGTNRWCREVTDAYGMTDELAEQSARLKRVSFAWAFTGILTSLLITSLGAAADPFSSSSDPSWWVIWHWVVGMAGTLFIGASFYAQFVMLSRNQELIQDVLTNAKRTADGRNR